MGRNDFLLGVEEVALAISLVGQPEVAYNLLVSQLGTMQQEEARARLLAAGHSLIARGWLTMDAQGTMHLADSLARVARVLSCADFSIRYSRAHRNVDLSLSFHFGEDGIFAHRVEQGVVHHITEVQSTDAVIQGGLEFFDLLQARSFTCPSTKIPSGLLDEIKDEREVSFVLRRLEEAGVTEKTRTLLAEDFCGAQYRGSILRVEYDEDNVPRSDHGLLVLRGPERAWLLRPLAQEGEVYMILMPGAEQAFRQEVTALL